MVLITGNIEESSLFPQKVISVNKNSCCAEKEMFCPYFLEYNPKKGICVVLRFSEP